jgi:hypothetical protein
MALAIMLALTPSVAMAQEERACLAPVEAQALIRYAMPEIIGQVSKACAASLPGTAYLVRSRDDLVARYTKASLPSLPVARLAFAKITKMAPDQIGKLRGETLRDMLGLGIAGAISGKIKPKDCGLINEIFEQLDPLPPENMTKLIGIAMREGDKAKNGDTTRSSPLRLCDGIEGK